MFNLFLPISSFVYIEKLSKIGRILGNVSHLKYPILKLLYLIVSSALVAVI